MPPHLLGLQRVAGVARVSERSPLQAVVWSHPATWSLPVDIVDKAGNLKADQVGFDVISLRIATELGGN